MKKLLAILLTAALLVACLTACGGSGKSGKGAGNSSYDGAIELYIKYLTGEATKSQIKQIRPQFFWDAFNKTPDDIYEEMKEDPEYPMDMLKEYYGKDVKITYEIVDKELYDEEEMDEIRSGYTEYAETTSFSAKKLTKVYQMDLEITIKGAKAEDTLDASALLMEYSGQWYVWNCNLDNPYQYNYEY